MSDLISRQDAIDAIEILASEQDSCAWNLAIISAIDAVKHHVPSAQPDCSDCIKHGGDWDCDHMHCHKGKSAQKTQLSGEGATSDCISRQAAIDYCYALINAEHLGDEMNYAQERVNQTEVILHHLEFMPSAQPERKTEKALRLLVEWAIECGFGYDNIPEEYEKYKDEIQGMGYTEGLIYIAMMEVEHDSN